MAASRVSRADLLVTLNTDIRLERLGLSLTALLFIQMSEHKKTDLDRILREILKIPEVRAGWMISGRFDAVVEVLTKNTSHLLRLVVERFSSREEISRFVAETKGSQPSLKFRELEKEKIKCVRKFFSEIQRRRMKDRSSTMR
ncbi:Lrp/AsnC family transcriptional regulator [Tritonibacter aquimaris]|uniref:Lrp/AsnC family transcriptional regulator n=1 Tax=Tritonibacter aquimaris TaxID=2663379 RepID=UPI0018860CBA|nr:Lrp/AsnC ligand binding domain-containing protein [Tritonibacter aquimaris]